MAIIIDTIVYNQGESEFDCHGILSSIIINVCVHIVIVYIMDVKVNCESIKLNMIELHKHTLIITSIFLLCFF